MSEIREIPCPCCQKPLYRLGASTGGPSVKNDRNGPHMICPHCSCRINFKTAQSAYGVVWDFADTQTCMKVKV